MPTGLVHHKTAAERTRESALHIQAAGLSSLQATLAKLNGDKARHETLVGDLATRLAMRRGSALLTAHEHKAMTFHESGYVFMKTLGQGRHGMMKLAKRKTTQHVKHTKAGVDTRRGKEMVSQYVAVRVIHRCAVRRGRFEESELLSTKEKHAVLLRHIEALRELDHPNIQREIETFEDQQQIYIVMELCTGGDLLAKESEPLPERRVAWLINQLCAAMSHAHDKGIVHQDLRPDNCHYATSSEDARLVVTDWACTEYIKTPPKESRQHLIMSEYSAPELDSHHRTDKSDMWSIGMMAFALLSFALPFGEHGPRAKAGNFEWHESDPSVSSECRDFISKILRLDPSQRLSAREAVAHPWLCEAREAHRDGKRKSFSKTTVLSLVHFRDSTVLHRTAAAMAADHLSGEKLYELTQQFQLIDKDGDGLVPKEDMIEALRNTLETVKLESKQSGAHELEELEEEIASLMDSQSHVVALVNLMDTDGDGKISYSDFLAAAADANMADCTALCWEAFRAFDRDGNGNISKSELQHLLATPIMDEVLEKTQHNLTRGKTKAELESALSEIGGSAQSVTDILKEGDENGDNRITFEEFMKIMVHSG